MTTHLYEPLVAACREIMKQAVWDKDGVRGGAYVVPAEALRAMSTALGKVDIARWEAQREEHEMTDSELYEKLAEIEHTRWADWQRYMHSLCTRNPDGSLTIPAESVERWERQIATPYAELSEVEKKSDRDQVDRYWPLLQQWEAQKHG